MGEKRISLKKNIYKYSLCMLMLLLLSGCDSNTDKNENKKNPDKVSIAENGINKVEPPKGKKIVNGLEVEYTLKESQEFNFETDYNASFKNRHYAATEGINIYVNMGEMIAFNKNNKYGVPFCEKPDCDHLSTECSTSFSEDYIQYCEGKLYAVDSINLSLCSLNLKTMERETVAKLLTVDKAEGTGKYGYTCNWIIHRGYLYYIYFYNASFDEDGYYLNNSNCLFRIPIDGSGEAECIMPLSMGIDPYSCTLEAYGSYIYMGMSKYADSKDKSVYAYRYNIETDTIESFDELDDNIVCFVNLGKDILYAKYVDEKESEIYLYTEDKTKKKLIDVPENVGSCWGDDDFIYIYYDENSKNKYIQITDYEGNALERVRIGTSKLNGDEEYVSGHYIGWIGSDEKSIYVRDEILTKDDSYNIYGFPNDVYITVKCLDKKKLKDGIVEYEIWKDK